MKLDQFAQFRFNSLTEEEGWNRIKEYVQYQDDLWDNLLPSMNVSSISEAMQSTFKGHLKRACTQISYLETTTREAEQPSRACILVWEDIYDDPSHLRFYQNDDTPLWGNKKCKEKGEDGPKWVVRSKFEDELANFILENKSYTKGIGEMLDQHRKEMHEQLSQILSAIGKRETPKLEAPTFSITTRLGPYKSSNLPCPSRVKKQKKDDKDERLLSIFKQIHINMPFLESMIYMPMGANVLKDLLSHKEKLEKAASSVKLSEECSAIIQRSLPQKEGDPRSFTLSCLIGPLVVKNALADLRASINLMPHSLLR
ncbi:hypothetical protein Tco_0778953 [Tanacetum coccineum]